MELDDRQESLPEYTGAREHKHKKKHKHAHGSHEACGHAHHGHGHNCVHEHNHKWKAFLGIIWGVGLIVLSVTSFYLSFTIPFIGLCAIAGATALVTLYLGYRIYFEAIKKLFTERKLTMGALYMISTLTILVVSIASLFIPWLPAMVEAAPLVLGLFHAGEALEEYYGKKIASKLKVSDLAVDTVKKIVDGQEIDNFPAKNLQPGDVIIVENGGVIPVDGELIVENKDRKRTNIYLNTENYNGKMSETLYKNGDEIFSGMCVNNKKPVKLRVTRTVEQSFLSGVDQNTTQEDSKKEDKEEKKKARPKAPIEEFTNKVFQYFVPGLLILAIISGLLIGFFFSPILAVESVIAIFVSACPCVLMIIVPLSVMIGRSKAAKKGIHFAYGEALQAATKIDVVMADLNGTFTSGKHHVEELEISPGESKEACLRYMMLLEKNSEQIIGKAIFEYAQKDSKNQHEEITPEDLESGRGRKAVIDGIEYMIGNAEAFDKNTIEGIEEKCPVGRIYLVREAKVIAKFRVLDTLRPYAKETVTALKKLGKDVRLITGANEVTAWHYARLLGIETVYADCVGRDGVQGGFSKAHHVREAKKNGLNVAVFGDGTNDRQAMNIPECSLGIVMESKATNAVVREGAGVLIKNPELSSLLTVFEVAEKTMDNIHQNLVISLVYNTAVVILAAGLLVLLFGISLNPVVGIGLMLGESFLVFVNMLRFKESQNLVSYQTTEHVTSIYEKVPRSLSFSGDPARKPLMEAQNNYSSADDVIRQKAVVAPVARERSDDEELGSAVSYGAFG